MEKKQKHKKQEVSAIIGVDIGGTKIYAARYNARWKVEAEITLPTQAEKGRATVYANIIRAIEGVIDGEAEISDSHPHAVGGSKKHHYNHNVAAVGIAWAGFVESKKGIIVKAPNIPGWRNVHLTHDIQFHFEIPTFIENDARLFTLAEQRLGAGKNLPHVIGLIIGTGVGSGMVLNNAIYRGANGFAGEIGHTFAALDPKSSPEIEEIFAGPSLTKYFRKNLGIKSFNIVESQIRAGRKRPISLFEKIIDRLAVLIYNLILIYNPDTIIFGGGIGKNVIPLFEKSLRAKVKKLLAERGYPPKIDIRFSKLTNGGALGAAIYALESLKTLIPPKKQNQNKK